MTERFNDQYRIQSNRLPGWNYARRGAYFVTICCKDHFCFFGNIQNGRMILNDLGQIADTEWKNTVNIRPNIILDTYIIMPNHMHGIIIIDYQIKPSKKITIPHPIIPNEKIFPHIDPHHSYNCRDKLQFVSTKNIFTGEDVSTLKTPKLTPSKQHRKPPYGTSQTIGAIVRGFKIGVTTHARKTTNIVDVWQPNYYDRVIRNKNELIRIREYISHNPLKWESDKNNLENIWL